MPLIDGGAPFGERYFFLKIFFSYGRKILDSERRRGVNSTCYPVGHGRSQRTRQTRRYVPTYRRRLVARFDGYLNAVPGARANYVNEAAAAIVRRVVFGRVTDRQRE